MRQNKLHQDTFINKFLNEKDLNFKNEVINIPFKPAPYQKKLSEVDKALNPRTIPSGSDTSVLRSLVCQEPFDAVPPPATS